MKIPAHYEVEEYSKAIGLGALKGCALGAGVSGALSFFLSRRTSFFKQAGGFHKTLLVAAPIIVCGVTNMEFASRDFEQFQRQRLSGQVPTTEQHKAVSSYDNLISFASNYKYPLIVGGWAASLGTALYVVNKDKYMTRSQKLVQARVYAQGFTVLLLVASVLLSVSNPEQERKEKAEKAKSSWIEDLKYVHDPAPSRK